MIKLPENFINFAFVNLNANALALHFKNAADEYFIYWHILDKAIPFEDHLESITKRDFSTDKAYVLDDHLNMSFIEPTDQDWKVAPIPAPGIVTLEQYKQMAGQVDA